MIGQDLIQDFKNGNSGAFKKLYHVFYNDVWSLCYRYTRNQEVAEELAHDAFLLLWENRLAVDPQQGIKPYLLAITRNEVFRWLKKSASDNAMKEELKKQFVNFQENVRQDIAIDATLDLGRIKAYLDSFPAKRRMVFELIKFADLSYSEVAERLCISRDTVKDHMVKANKSLLKLNKSGEFTYQFLLFSYMLLC